MPSNSDPVRDRRRWTCSRVPSSTLRRTRALQRVGIQRNGLHEARRRAPGWAAGGRPGSIRPFPAIERVSNEVDRLMFISIAHHEMGHAQESQRALDTLAANADGREANVAYRIALVHAWRGE